MDSLKEVYGHIDAICMITIAPELPNAIQVCQQLEEMGVIVSVGKKGFTNF